MKTIGLIGGMSWESTETYYRIINESVKKRLGGFHSARLALVSVDFHEIERLQEAGDWERMGRVLSEAARSVERAGADFFLICTNTMHKVAGDVQRSVNIPLLHIADATGERIRSQEMGKVGLLGTSFTMEQDFYRERLADSFGLTVLVPEENDREFVHHVIYDELVLGVIEEASRGKFVEIIEQLGSRGVEGVILGCTEIPLLVGPDDVDMPLFDTTRIHAEAAVERYLLTPSTR